MYIYTSKETPAEALSEYIDGFDVGFYQEVINDETGTTLESEWKRLLDNIKTFQTRRSCQEHVDAWLDPSYSVIQITKLDLLKAFRSNAY